MLLAFALRIIGIDQWGDLDFDEQASYFIGAMAPGDMLRYLLGAPFEHPPLFYLLFHGWLGAIGGTETAMRLFAVIPGTLAVAVIGVAVARVTDARTGFVAAAVLALAPLHVFHSRDARMYTLLSLLMAAMLAAIASGWARRAVLGAVAAAAALATHYYAFFGVLGVASAWALHSRRLPLPLGAGWGEGETLSPAGLRVPDTTAPARWPFRQWGPLLALGVAVAAAAGVWVASASGLRTSLTAVRLRAVDPPDFLWTLVQSLGAPLAGPLAPPALVVVAAGTTAAMLLIGHFSWTAPLRRFGRSGRAGAGPPPHGLTLNSPGGRGQAPPLPGGRVPAGTTPLVAWQSARGAGAGSSLLAAAGWGGFLCTTVGIPTLELLSRPFAARFVVLGTPFLAALLALGSRRLGTPALVVAGAVYVGVAGFALAPMYGGYERSDYGEALARLRAEARPDDGVILNGPWQDLLYRRYGVGLPAGQIVASTVPLQADETVGWLRRITAEHPRVWVVDSATDAADPMGAVAAWLDANAYPRPVIGYQKALLRPYLTDGGEPLVARPIDASALGVRFTSVGMDRWTLEPGAESRLRIEGLAVEGSASRDSLRAVVDLLGHGGASVWHWDGPLTRSGEMLTYRAAVLVPLETAPGEYRLQLTAYEAEGSGRERRVVRIGEPVTVGAVSVRTRVDGPP